MACIPPRPLRPASLILFSIFLPIKEGRETSFFSFAPMSFCGTQDKCKACDRTVHFIDLITADGIPYHKTCFKCSHCRGTLSMCNYSSMDGVLYCKTHFEQLFKETGSFAKNFNASTKSAEKLELSRTPSKISQLFSGTQDNCLREDCLSIGEARRGGRIIPQNLLQVFPWRLHTHSVKLCRT